jgi:hypothetical protein
MGTRGQILRRLSGAALGLAVIVSLAEGAAMAAEVVAQLDYAAAAGCPVAAAFEANVVDHLGYRPFRDDAAQRVVIRIEASGRGLEGRVEWRNEAGGWAGERMFPSRSADCSDLTRAMAFAVALQFQLLAAAQSGAPRPAAPPAVTSTATEPATAPALTAKPAASSTREMPTQGGLSRPTITVGAGAAAGVGVAPNVTALGRLFGAISWPHFAFELAAEASVPSTFRRADGAGFSQQVLLAGLAGCGVSGRWSGCLLLKVGEIRVAGEGVDSPGTAAAPFLQTGARLAVTQPLGRRAQLVLHGGGFVPITRGVVTLDSMPVWTTPRVAATGGLDFGVRFQ